MRFSSAMLSTLLLFAVSLPCASAQQASPTVIRVLDNNHSQSASMDFFIGLLDLALQQSEAQFGPYQLEHVEVPHSQTRAMYLLNQGNILDVMHSMSTDEREFGVLPVRIPLMMGLMGHRMLLVKASRIAEFSQPDIVKKLPSLIACQGTDWPDSAILEANGFIVAKVSHYDAMLAMLEKERCDYFPRGLNEIYSEFSHYNGIYGKLAIAPDIMLYYPAPIYFFVAANQQTLAKRIELGLAMMIERHALQDYIAQHPTTRFIYPLSQWQDMQVIELKNPLLTHIPLSSEMWLQLGQRTKVTFE